MKDLQYYSEKISNSEAVLHPRIMFTLKQLQMTNMNFMLMYQ